MTRVGTTRKKRHHFRPILHLRHFVDATGQLWVHDRSGAVPPFQQIPDNVGFEKDLYVPEGGADAGTDAFENWLAEHVDGPAAAPLAKAVAAQPLSRSERSSLAGFIAAQDLRTPRARDLITALFHAGLQEEWKKWEHDPQSLADAIRKDSGTSYSADEIRDLLSEYDFRVTRDAWLGVAQDMLNKIAKKIYGMTWSYGRAPDGAEFITTDIGIAKCSRPAQFVPWELGFAGQREVWVFPLSPEATLVLSPRGRGHAGTLKGEWVRAANARLLADAHRFVYSRSKLPNGDATT